MGQGGKREARHDVYEPAGPQAVMVWSEKYQRLGKERGEGNSKKKNGWNKWRDKSIRKSVHGVFGRKDHLNRKRWGGKNTNMVTSQAAI